MSSESSSQAQNGAAAPGSYGAEMLRRTITGNASTPPVLLLHGWGSSAANMAPIAQALASDYRVMSIDLPGHGHSPAPTEVIGIPEHAALVKEIIDTHIGKPVTIVGHSNGGRIALYMASHPLYKPLIRHLVLVSPSGVTPNRSVGYYARRTIANMLKAPFRLAPEPLRAYGLDWLRHSLAWRALGSSDYRAVEGVMRSVFVRMVTYRLDERVQEIDVPVLLFRGDRDTAISQRQMEYLVHTIPDAGLVVLENAGHYGYMDDFATFIAATRHFLKTTC